MPRDVSKTWLWTSQNAFLTETDPTSGTKWKDRYGVAFGKGKTVHGNVESYLSYKKLHRTGKLLRSLKVRSKKFGNAVSIILSNSAPYASVQEAGGFSAPKVVKGSYVTGGAKGVVLGGNVYARPFMRPSRQVLRAPKKLVEAKMKQYGWSK